MKSFLSAALLILLAASSSAQIREGLTRELSISGGYQNTSSEGSSGSSGALLVSPRIGFFIHRGLEIEPEATFMAGSGMDVVYMLNGLVSYNFSTASPGVPFLIAGFGISNTLPFFDVPIGDFGFAVGVLNLGAGLKIFIKDDVAVRLEYRYQNFSGSEERTDFGGYSYTRNVDVNLHTLQFGFGVFF